MRVFHLIVIGWAVALMWLVGGGTGALASSAWSDSRQTSLESAHPADYGYAKPSAGTTPPPSTRADARVVERSPPSDSRASPSELRPRRAARSASSSFGGLAHSSQGIKSYAQQAAVTAGQRGEIQAHHLLEKRFARQLGGNTDEYASIVATRSEHQAFTNAWRREIPYGEGTRTASRAEIQAAASRIYADYPEILKALNLP